MVCQGPMVPAAVPGPKTRGKAQGACAQQAGGGVGLILLIPDPKPMERRLCPQHGRRQRAGAADLVAPVFQENTVEPDGELPRLVAMPETW